MKEKVFDFLTPYPDFDIKALNEYAHSKGVKLITYDTNALTIKAGETCDDILGELRLNLEELSVIGYSTNHLIPPHF